MPTPTPDSSEDPIPFRRIVRDLYQVHIPLPFALNRVNCYLLRGDHGWTILDTGLNTAKARAIWRDVWRQLAIQPADIAQIILTHVHPDHYGLAGWIQEVCQRQDGRTPPVLTSTREANLAIQFWRTDRTWEEDLRRFWSRCGAPPELATAMVASTAFMRQRVRPHPKTIDIIAPGETIRMGGRSFQAFLMPGHSDGQLVFHDAGDRLLLCGDHVLSKITANIGLWPQGEPDPLGRYLASLDVLERLPTRLSLPGHGPLMTNLPGRLQALRAHHAARLEQTLAIARPGVTPYQAGRQIFEFDELSVHEKRFAVVETLAHLEHLVERGPLRRRDGDDLVYEAQ